MPSNTAEAGFFLCGSEASTPLLLRLLLRNPFHGFKIVFYKKADPEVLDIVLLYQYIPHSYAYGCHSL